MSDFKKPHYDILSILPNVNKDPIINSLSSNIFNKYLTKDESRPFIGYVGNKEAFDNSSVYLSQTSQERKINNLQPVIYTKYGSEELSFTFNDILSKLDVLGVDVTNFDKWGAAQSFNFAPPINFDMFCNYTRYFWIGHLVNQTSKSRPSYNQQARPEYYVIERDDINASPWQIDNYWIHQDDLENSEFSASNAIQAIRPIIQYDAYMVNSINSSLTKTIFNQVPLFALFNENGTNAGVCSSIFFYKESNTMPVDVELDRRVVINGTDYVFENGLLDSNGTSYFYKKSESEFYSIWKPGRIESPVFAKYDEDTKTHIPTDKSDPNGAWAVPNQMLYNMDNENRSSVGYGDLFNHFVSIIGAQENLTGSQFGSNNYRKLKPNVGLGGMIKQYNGGFNLFASILNQDFITPVSIINFAKDQYLQLLNSVNEFVTQRIGDILSDGRIYIKDDYFDSRLYDLFNTHIAGTTNNIFYNTSSGVKNWVVTLPYLGLVKKTMPRMEYDYILNRQMIVHHDGHKSFPAMEDVSIKKNIVTKYYTRDDGLTTMGLISNVLPAKPYKNQFWFRPTDNALFVFSVQFDEIPSGDVNVYHGDVVYNRNDGSVFVYDGYTATWQRTTDLSSIWKEVFVDQIINTLLLQIETDLYNGAPEYEDSKFIVTDTSKYDADMQEELSKFASKYQLDPFTTNANDNDPFTWNYSSEIFEELVDGEVVSFNKAVWHELYKNIYGTARPDLEPWKIIGQTPDEFHENFAEITPEAWAYVKSIRNIPLSVDTETNTLLAPYNYGHPESLFQNIPSSINDFYSYGDNGPVEFLWKYSTDFQYGKSIVKFKHDPIKFVSTTWGYKNRSVGVYEIDNIFGRKLQNNDFYLHGESVKNKSDSYSITDFVIYDFEPFERKLEIKISGYAHDGKTCYYSVTEYVSKPIPQQVGNMWKIVATRATGVVGQGYFVAGHYSFRVNVPNGRTRYNVGDKIIVSIAKNSLETFTTYFEPAETNIISGMNELYTNVMRYNSYDLNVSKNNSIFRNWDIKLGYRADGLINTETLRVETDLFTMPSSNYKILIKENKNTNSLWITALRIQLVRRGSTQNVNGVQMPRNKGEDWMFRVETFNNEHPTIEFYEFDKADSGYTFNIINGTFCKETWVRKTKKTNLRKINAPFIIRGIQNVADFIFGYEARLVEMGWRFSLESDPRIDATTGRTLSWQLEVEKFIEQQYSGVVSGSGILLNTFAENIFVSTDRGMVSSMLTPSYTDSTISCYALDLFGTRIPNDQLTVIRTDETTTISAKIPMFAGHITISEYEHIIIFDNAIAGTKLVYDPYLGARVNRVKFYGEMQSASNGRLSYGGHIITSKGSQANIESLTSGILNYYDSDNMVEGSKTAKYARKLLGYTNKDYLDDMGFSDHTKFEFWKGMIKHKGTNFSIDAFINNKNFKSAKLDEFWAYKIAEYGDARPLEYPELNISSDMASTQFVKFRFRQPESNSATKLNDFIDVYPYDETLWHNIDDLGTHYYFDPEVLLTITHTVKSDVEYIDFIGENGETIFADNITIETLDGGIIDESLYTFVNANTVKLHGVGIDTIIRITCYGPSQPKFNPAKLINYKDRAVICDLELWDPARGQHSSLGMSVVDICSKNDPAKYNYSLVTKGNENYSPYSNWGKSEVGKVWWDMSTLSYLPYYDRKIYSDVNERISRWGSLSDWASVNLYEWTESEYHPSEYDAIAEAQEKNADIDIRKKYTGRASYKDLYSRNRTWKRRPIAWMVADKIGIDKPTFRMISEAQIYLTNSGIGEGYAILSENRWANINASIGDKLAGVTIDQNDPYYNVTSVFGEAQFTDDDDYIIGSEKQFDAPKYGQSDYIYNISAERSRSFGDVLGMVVFSHSIINGVNIVKATAIEEDISQSIELTELPTFAGELISLDFNLIGIKLTAQMKFDLSSDWNIQDDKKIEMVASSLGNPSHDICIRSAKKVRIDIPFKSNVIDFTFNVLDAKLNQSGVSWIVWSEPSVKDVAADINGLKFKPIIGEEYTMSISDVYINANDMLADAPVFQGNVYKKFVYSWGEWNLLRDIVKEIKIKGKTDTLKISFGDINHVDVKSRIYVYINGMFIMPGLYDVTTDFVDLTRLLNDIDDGSNVRIVLKKIIPSDAQLNFNPDVNDTDATLLTQYKYDYQYSSKIVYNSNGEIEKTLYYFWVSNKIVPFGEKKLSLQNAVDALTYNKEPFGILQIVDDTNVPNFAYNSFIAANILNYVRMDNTYKLRFTKNFILRDDPREQNLKNVHAEWILIKQSQKTKIPEKLWNLITNAICGENILGERLPAKYRVDYDDRHGTKTRYGFGKDQIFVSTDLARSTLLYTILNTQVMIDNMSNGGTRLPSMISFPGFDINNLNIYFSDAKSLRVFMTNIWNNSNPENINEIFFNILHDAISENYEMTDIMKTSFISIHSIKIINANA